MKDTRVFFQINTTQKDSIESDMGDSSLESLPSKFSKPSSMYIIQPKINSNRNKSNRGNAILPYNKAHNQIINEEIEEDHKLHHAETVRQRPTDTLFNEEINRSKTTTDRQENQQRDIKICKCKKCGRLSFFENNVCFYCHRSASQNWRSLIYSSVACCCWCVT